MNWALVNGETETGATLHKMVKRPDAGDIVGQQKVTIADSDTALTLHKSAGSRAGRIEEQLPKLKNGTATFTKQDESQASYFGRRTAADGGSCGTSPPKRSTTWYAPSRNRTRVPSATSASAS